jgi:hypothetical protein
MAANTLLDDAATPAMLQRISVEMEEARYRDNRGRLNALTLELKRICTRIRDELRDLNSCADPDLLIVLWSTDQISHGDGLEYARTTGSSGPDAVNRS